MPRHGQDGRGLQLRSIRTIGLTGSRRMNVSALLFGLVLVLAGLVFLAISNPLAKLATSWNLFIDQDPDVLEAYRSMKLQRIRVLAKGTLVLGAVIFAAGLIGWAPGLA
jgi:hypothetical protein